MQAVVVQNETLSTSPGLRNPLRGESVILVQRISHRLIGAID
jgi:hypothetical protein